MNFKDCRVDDGIYYVNWYCGGYESEWDSEDTWPYLVNCFNSEVNTMIDHESECGISWVPDNQKITPTPKNVLSWARNKKQYFRM